MQLIPLLGKQLKDDQVIDILEGFDMEVIYDFDRLHEGQPDKYWASSKQAGLQFRFDADQQLDIVFVYISPKDGFSAFSQRDSDILFFNSAAEVQSFGESQDLKITEGRVEFSGVARDWVRLGFATHSVHYQYEEDSLTLVTITPGRR